MRALIIGYVWPEPNSSAAGRRIVEIIAALQEQGAEVEFACAASKGEHSIDLGDLTVSTAAIALNCSSFDDYVTALQPDLVVFDRFVTEEQFGWRVDRSCPDAIKVLDTEDLHCLRLARHAAHKQQRPLQREDLMSEVAAREVAAIWRCDLSLIISEYERDLLCEVFGVAPEVLHYLPLLSTGLSEEDISAWPSFSQRQHCVVVGNFRHAPNWDAMQYLRADIWPLIRQRLPGVECHIYGAYPPPKAMQLHSEKLGFMVKGWADSAVQVVSAARLCLAPLRFGAGQKGKLLEAMECGTPSITTAIGVEGMQGDMPWGGGIADGAEAFARLAISLYAQEDAWQLAQARGAEIVRQRFDADSHKRALKNRLNILRENFSTERKNNFNGLMLRHHSMKSHQYMSQWIEAKNKNANIEH